MLENEILEPKHSTNTQSKKRVVLPLGEQWGCPEHSKSQQSHDPVSCLKTTPASEFFHIPAFSWLLILTPSFDPS